MADHCVLEVGFSGGLDSVVLLHLLWRWRQQQPVCISAVHVHHGLQTEADAWAEFCQQWCDHHAIPLRTERLSLTQNGVGIEAAARAGRYAVFAHSRAPIVALAHHRDDQTETFFLAAMRGSGVRGLSAMPSWRRLNDTVCLWRPLLSFSRAQLGAYAAEWGLAWVEDPSNACPDLLRSWLRHHGLPAWRQRLPAIDRHISASVAVLQDELAVLDEVMAADWQTLHGQGRFDVALWRHLSPARQQQQLRHFARHHGLGNPSRAGLLAFAAVLRQSGVFQAAWPLPAGQAVLHGQTLWPQWLDWRAQWPELSTLPATATWSAVQWRRHAFGLPDPVSAGQWRHVRHDDVLRLAVGRKKVKKMLQERHIPTFMRNIWPILTAADGTCLAVANVAVDVTQGKAGGWLPVVPALPFLA